jgi:hypothetical protein
MRVKKFFCTLLLLFNVVLLFAQGDPTPCLAADIDTQCPLDTWVVILAVIAVVFAATYLHRKQKSLKPGAKGI